MEIIENYNGMIVEHVFPDEPINMEKISKQLSLLATQIYKENTIENEFPDFMQGKAPSKQKSKNKRKTKSK